MNRSWMMLTLALFASMTAVGCKNALYDDNQRYREQNSELQEQNATLNQRNAALEEELGRRPDASQVAGLQSSLADREAKIRDLEAKLRTQPAGAPTPGIEGIETEYDAATGEMTVRVPGDVLFDPGVATLKPGSKATLDKIAAALNGDYSGKQVRVEGHTDSDPLQRTRAQWIDNRALSSARAIAVTRYLESKGVSPKRIASIGYGEYHPRGSDKSKNRRVEIIVVTR